LQRHCDGTDPNLLAADGSPCACGLSFDDLQYGTFYPHLAIAAVLTEQQREAWYRFLGVSADA
jgi:hypothetical protein